MGCHPPSMETGVPPNLFHSFLFNNIGILRPTGRNTAGGLVSYLTTAVRELMSCYFFMGGYKVRYLSEQRRHEVFGHYYRNTYSMTALA